MLCPTLTMLYPTLQKGQLSPSWAQIPGSMKQEAVRAEGLQTGSKKNATTAQILNNTKT